MMMRALKILSIFSAIILMLFINYKTFISSQIQPFLIADLNEGMHRYSLSDAIKADINFPSLSGPTQPVKMLVGRYYRNVDSIDTAKRLFLDAIKDNPYIKSPQAQLAYLYLDIEEFDSAYYYAKDAFNGIPNNNVHRDIFFKTLVQRKDSLELKESFELLLELSPNNSSHWLGYMDSRYQIVGPQDSEILDLISRFENQFPNFDKRVIDGVKVIANSDVQDLSFGASFAELGDNLFEEGDYFMAAQHYEIAISYAEFEYAYYENAAISYYLAQRYDKAANYFKKVIDEFEINDGKSEFYMGILQIELDSISKGCDYLLKSSNLGFAGGSNAAYNNFCN
jgi:tetratricopeptide (TPR) repeat protein